MILSSRRKIENKVNGNEYKEKERMKRKLNEEGERKRERKEGREETNLSQMGNHIQWKEFSVYCLIP